jgi:hypothetical protein
MGEDYIGRAAQIRAHAARVAGLRVRFGAVKAISARIERADHAYGNLVGTIARELNNRHAKQNEIIDFVEENFALAVIELHGIVRLFDPHGEDPSGDPPSTDPVPHGSTRQPGYQELCDTVGARMWVAEPLLVAVTDRPEWTDDTADLTATLRDAGASWAMPFLETLHGMLDDLDGAPDTVVAHTAAWNDMADELLDMASHLDTLLRNDLPDWKGPAAEAYGTMLDGNAGILEQLAGIAVVLSSATAAAGDLVRYTRRVIHGIIADVMARVVARPDTPDRAAWAHSAVADAAARIRVYREALVASIDALRGLLDDGPEKGPEPWTYDFAVIGEPRPEPLRDALAAWIGGQPHDVDLSGPDGFTMPGEARSDGRLRVTCLVRPAVGDLNWHLAVTVDGNRPDAPTSEYVASLLADRLGVTVAYPCDDRTSDVYFLATPDGRHVRTRLAWERTPPAEDDNSPLILIVAADQPVPGRPNVPVVAVPQTLDASYLDHPVTDRFCKDLGVWLIVEACTTQTDQSGEWTWPAADALEEWEDFIERIAGEWWPDDDPARAYHLGLRARDTIARYSPGLPAPIRVRFDAALAELDAKFVALTGDRDGSEPHVDEVWWRYRTIPGGPPGPAVADPGAPP